MYLGEESNLHSMGSSCGRDRHDTGDTAPADDTIDDKQYCPSDIHKDAIKSSNNDWSSRWTATVNRLRAPILSAMQWLTHLSATNPKCVVFGTVALSVFLFAIGLSTNFTVDNDENVLWTPMGSHPVRNMQWIEQQSGFPKPPRLLTLLFHQDGSTTHMMGRSQIQQVFQAVDLVRSLDQYPTVCALWSETNDCAIYGVTKFWNQSADVLNRLVQSDADVIAQMSTPFFPDDGTPVSDHSVWGHPLRDSKGLLVSVQLYVITVALPSPGSNEDLSAILDFETKALAVLGELRDSWKQTAADTEDTLLQMEVVAKRSTLDELERAIMKDILLVPVVLVIMGVFTCMLFFRCDKVQSRCWFGLTALLSVVLSIMTGYGLMFWCGVPFTSVTKMLPFVFVGVGLDDAFLLTGSYFRLDSSMDPVDRVRTTVNEVGISIFLTTLTSAVAMGLGCTSRIPAVFWLCLYAAPTSILILLIQLTFFVGCLVLDERRVAAQSHDCLRCLSSKPALLNCSDKSSRADTSKYSIDGFMGWYADALLLPRTKALVLFLFSAALVACATSTSHLRQAFSFTDILPNDSYVTPFVRVMSDFSARTSVTPAAYFRGVDQSNPAVQDEMEHYINELVSIDAIGVQPQFCWLRDFRSFVANTSDLITLPFTMQLDAFLAEPVYSELYLNHIVRNDQTGMIAVSRCFLNMDGVDQDNVKDQIKALNDQQAVSDNQPVNSGQSDFRFFTYDSIYNTWQFQAQSTKEVTLSTVTSIAVMTGIAFLLMPHWSAALFVLPLICILYIDLMGVAQWAGVSINPVSYIALVVMSIGLLVDFVIHVLLRFYEAPGNRHEKVVDLLKTMGSSILIGAITTFLGTLPLAFSTSNIFYTIFIAFLALVVLGATHGLILLPVILSMIGPEVEIPPVWAKPAVMTSPVPQGARPTGARKRVDDDGLDDLESVHG